MSYEMPANDAHGFYDAYPGGPDDMPTPIPEGAVFVEGPSLENVIEGVGTIPYAAVPIYSKADKKSKIIRHALPGEKLLITANNKDWYCVRAYNGKEGFVERRNLRTVKVFYDESVTTNHMSKRLNIELKDLIKRFNLSIQDSVYLQKFQVVPKLSMVNSYRSVRKNTITIVLEYSAVDKNGTVIPSKQVNNLSKSMRIFIGLLFKKMLPSQASEYHIVIKRPQFAANGRLLSSLADYAELSLHNDKATLDVVRDPDIDILSFVDSTIPINELFIHYPH